MDFGEEYKCNQCLGSFSPKKRPLKMPSCKHNICQHCFDEILASKLNVIQCQFCGKMINDCQRIKLQINHVLVKKIKKIEKKEDCVRKVCSSPGSPFKLNSNLSVFEDGEMLLGEDDSNMKRKKSMNSIIRSQLALQSCPLHKKSLEIICLNDLKRICAHCAIFGDHKNHKFKTFQQFNEDYEEKMKDLQIIKQKKYKFNKKYKYFDENTSYFLKLNEKKSQIMEEIASHFEDLVQKIKIQEQKIKSDLEKTFQQVEIKIHEFLKEEGQAQNQFSVWESECENLLNRVYEDISLNEKINILYSPSLKMEKGDRILTSIQKKLQEINLKINNQINTIKVDYEEPKFHNLVKIYKSKQNQIFIGEKAPKTLIKSKNEENFNDNSFICGFNSREISMIVEDPQIKITSKSPQVLRQTTKIFNPKVQSRLIRCKSDLNIKLPNKSMEKKKIRSKHINSSITGNPEAICVQFLKKDLKDVLDLSNCSLNDDQTFDYLKEVRRYRKIRGLKLNLNSITDSGFTKAIDLLGSTSNLNLSNNDLTQEVLNIIIKNRDKFSPLRIINVAGNKLNQKRAKILVQALKKIGIMVTL